MQKLALPAVDPSGSGRKRHLPSIINKHRSTMTKRLFLPIAAILMTLSACGGDAPPRQAPEQDLIAVLKKRPSLTKFTEALEATGVAGTLLPGGAYTLFVPIDKAVNGPLDEATIRHHILTTRVTFSDMAGESTSYDTLNNDQIEIDVTDQIAIGSGLMVESDINAANGVIHVIDQVQAPVSTPAALIDQEAQETAPADNTVTPAAPAVTTN